jgi:hypothetical protein
MTSTMTAYLAVLTFYMALQQFVHKWLAAFGVSLSNPRFGGGFANY